MVALTGTETLQVLGQNPTGVPAATTFQTTTAAIAALADATQNPPVINTAISTVGAGTLTAAGIVGGIITRTGPVAAYTDTVDTAVNIVAALTAYVANESFPLHIRNNTAFVQTIATAAGVTLTGNVLIPPYSDGFYLVTITSPTAVTIFQVATGPISTVNPSVITTLSTVGAGTITAAGIAGGITSRTGAQSATPFTDTTATAALIAAAVPNLAVGQAFRYTYQNTTNATATITGGVGVTVSIITAVPAGYSASYLLTYTATNTFTMVGFAAGQSLAASQQTLILSGSTSGTTILNATAVAGSTTITFPAATDTVAVLGTAQTWTAAQTYTNSLIKLLGSSTGATTFTSANAGATNYTHTLPAWSDSVGFGNGGRVTSQLSKTTDTTLAAVTGLTASLVAGGTYKVYAYVPTTSGASGGVKVALNTSDTLTLTSSNITATLNTASASAVVTTTSGLNTGLGSTAAVTLAIIDATLVVNAAGTLTVTFAQNASDGTASIALVNGHVYVTRIA